MYLNYYQLQMMPFEIGPDPRFLWLGEKHEEAFAILQYGILESKGFIVIVGEPGTGKSTLLNATVASFGSNVFFAKISDPALTEMDFFNVAANALRMGRNFQNKAEFLIQLEAFVKAAGVQFKKVIFVIDEAQRLAPETLEQLRVFSNVELPGQKVVSCIFAGQPEFLDTIRKNRALSQRVFLSHIIQPLTQPETEEYIAHRLKVAGRDEPIFTAAAVQEAFRLSRGNPRLINILCDQALLIGYSTHLKTIGPETVRETTKNASIRLQSPSKNLAAEPKTEADAGPPSPLTPAAVEPAPSEPPPQAAHATAFRRKTAYFGFAALMLLLALAAISWLNGGFRMASTGPPKATEPAVGRDRSSAPEGKDSDVVRLQGQVVELRKEKEDAEAHLGELRRSIEALENEHRQLAEIASRRNDAEARLGDAQKQIDRLTASANELKTFREKAVQLETAVAERDKKLAQVEQKIGELEKLLSQEKGVQDQMGVELSSRQAAIADFQNKLDAAKAAQMKLESDVQNVRSENARLQAQVRELKAGQPESAPAPAPLRPSLAPAPSPAPVSSAASADEPDPAHAIEFLLKKKSQ